MADSCSCDQSVHCMDFIQAMQLAIDDAREQLGAVDHAGHADGEYCNCNMPQTCGPVAWKILHAWADAVHDQICSACGGFAREAATAVHDMVNAELGKPVQDPENLAAFCGRVRSIEATQPSPPGSVIASIDEQLGVVSAAQETPMAAPWRIRRRNIQLEDLNYRVPRRIRANQGIAQEVTHGVVSGVGFSLGGLLAHRLAKAAARVSARPAPSGGQDVTGDPIETSQAAIFTPDAQFADADRLAADAERLLAQGDIRDAAEKAWGATVAAARAFAIQEVGPSDDLRISTAVRHTLARAAGNAGGQSRQRQLLTIYNDRQTILHGDCFYLGECADGPLVEVMIGETREFIASMRRLVYGDTG